MSRRLALALLACVAATLAAVDDQPWPLAESRTDTIYLRDADPMFGIVENEASDGSFDFVGEKGQKFHFTKDRVDHVERKRAASQIVTHNVAVYLKRKDGAGVIRTLEFGLEKNSADAVKAGLTDAIASLPGDTDIAQFAFKNLGDAKAIEDVARATLKKNELFEPAYEALAKVLFDQDRLPELDTVVKQWIAKRPTSETANRLMGAAAEKRGDLRTAAECYRKGKDLHKSSDAALGYARCSLKLGDHANALKAANDLIAANDHGDEAAAIAGAALLMEGDAAAAMPLLQRAAAGTLPDELARIARYDLGLAKWKSGDQAGAKQVWQASSTPESQLALAVLEHRAFGDAASLAHPRLRAIAQELNACLDLEAKNPAKAAGALDPRSSKRHQFLKDVADTLTKNGDEASVRALAATPGNESLRWQAYAHLLAGRWKDAEAALAKLPEQDGWAAAYRVYCAAAQREDGRARDLYAKIATATDAPADYVARLAAEYEVADDAHDIEDFEWKDGDVLGTGWQSSAIGTNIHVHAENGQLVLDGAQTQSADPVSRAWRVVPAARLRSAQLQIDASALGGATGGIELMDDTRAAGCEVGVRPDSGVAWRAYKDGAWTAWEKLPLQITGKQAVLRIEQLGGRVFATQPDNPAQRFAVGDKIFAQPPERLCVGVFGVAEPGTQWRVAAETLELQLRPAAPAR